MKFLNWGPTPGVDSPHTEHIHHTDLMWAALERILKWCPDRHRFIYFQKPVCYIKEHMKNQ